MLTLMPREEKALLAVFLGRQTPADTLALQGVFQTLVQRNNERLKVEQLQDQQRDRQP